MKVRLSEIIESIEDFAPAVLQEDYDNSGLVIGDRNREVSKAIIALDVTEEIVDEAIEKGADLIISHHPLIFSGLKSITGDTYIERSVIKAIKSGIAIYSAHTNLDSVAGGVNGVICDKLGLKKRELLSHTPEARVSTLEDGEYGIGFVGELDQAVELECFLRTIGDVFGLKVIKHSKPIQRDIKRVAVCGGSGISLLTNAIRAKADIFVTSDVKYHDYFGVEGDLVIADIGHYESEQFTKDLFYDIISKKFPNFVLEFSEVGSNPVSHLIL